MLPSFQAAMAELDRTLEACRTRAPFNGSTVTDASSRHVFDWPWWGVQLSQTTQLGSDSYQVTASLRLSSTHAGEPADFQGSWRAEMWTGISPDQIDVRGNLPLVGDHSSSDFLVQSMVTLLASAWGALPPAARP